MVDASTSTSASSYLLYHWWYCSSFSTSTDWRSFRAPVPSHLCMSWRTRRHRAQSDDEKLAAGVELYQIYYDGWGKGATFVQPSADVLERMYNRGATYINSRNTTQLRGCCANQKLSQSNTRSHSAINVFARGRERKERRKRWRNRRKTTIRRTSSCPSSPTVVASVTAARLTLYAITKHQSINAQEMKDFQRDCLQDC